MRGISEQSIVGTYRLVQRLGAGGMGEVWIGEHARLGRRAAIKLLHDSFARDPEIVNRFFNEARAATAIADPGIVQVFDFGSTDEGVAYLVMELLFGESLEQRLRRAPLSLSTALRLMRQVASSLGAAHRAGIVHRDIKPDNIFIVADPEVVSGERTKILDFGIAKLSSTDAVRTHTSAVMGTPTFMSPEQCRGAGQVDARADVYSLGCVMFMLLAGRPPFVAEGVGELISMHVRDEAPRLSSFLPAIPAAADDLVAACLAKDPARRPANGAALAAQLDTVLAMSSNPHLAGSMAMPVSAATTTLSSAVSVGTPTMRRRGPLLAGVAFGVLAIGGLLVATQLRRGNDAPIAPAAATTPPAVPDAGVDAPIAAAPVGLTVDAAPPDAAIAVEIPIDAAPHKRRPTPAPDTKLPPPAPAYGTGNPPPSNGDTDDDFQKRLQQQRQRSTTTPVVKPLD